jgi:RNA polymerase sigma factor (TIGR02999 family)
MNGKSPAKLSQPEKIVLISSRMADDPRHISGMLAAWNAGDEHALDALVSAVYPELRRIARHHLSRVAGDHTLESAALANEAYLKLVRASGIRCEDRTRFFALCAQIIRRILVDHARTHRSAKRGGDDVRIPLDDAMPGIGARAAGILALDEALLALSKADPRKGRVVELRYFGGLSVQETAQVLGVSPETILRDWKMAKAWLFRELANPETE